MLLLTLRGTPTIYQGEEIGMEDVAIPEDQIKDPFELNVPGFGLGRDPVRTPMPWTAEEHGGFTEGRPFQRADRTSMLSLYKALIKLRRQNEVLLVGAFRLVAADESVLSYTRELGERHLLVALKLTDRDQFLRGVPGARAALLSTYLDDPATDSADDIHLRPNEGLMFGKIAEMLSG